MKKGSLITKITLWFSLTIALISVAAVFITIAVGNSVIRRGIRESLVATVLDNYDEIEFYTEYDRLEFDDPYDVELEYKNGYIEIDDDFIRSVNGIDTSLFDDNGLLYGDGTHFSEEKTPPFQNKTVSIVKDNGTTYYVYDTRLSFPAMEGGGLWLRGVVSAEYSISQVNTITKAVLVLLPFLMLLAVVGGYIISKRALSPMLDIRKAAEDIENGSDLSKRIEIEGGSSEVRSMADSFNAMFGRLEDSFNKEQQLTSDISHELRTPVSVIGAQCRFSLENEDTKEEYAEALELIERQTKKMSRVINDMLAFSRIERGAAEIQKEKLNLSECVSSVCEDMALIREKGITLESDIENNIYVDGNFELLTRLTVNLISNTYRYGKENGKTLVTLKKNGDTAVLSVKDNGIGIGKDDIEKIWDRFFRSDSSRNSGGTGLGLAFVKEIAEIHGASVGVKSEKDIGSEFFVTFPVL